MGRSFFRPAHRDAAEPAIINALRSVGATVWPISGKDVPDLLVGYRGVTYLLEVKSRIQEIGKGRTKAYTRVTKVSEGQKAFMEEWKGGVVRVVFTPEEALMAVGAPVEGVLQPIPGMRMMPVSVGAAMLEAMKRPPREGQDDARDALGAAGHIVTPAYQKAQTEAVVPKRRKK